MDRHTVNWKGYMPAISTPFHQDGTVDWDGWKSLLTWLVDEGMHGLVINGTTGEWFSQTTEEMEELFRVAAEVVNGDIPIIAGCTAYTPEQVVRHAGLAEKAKLDGILVAPPPYIVPTNEELVAYYQYINDHVPLPICVYNWPRGTNVDMNTELIGRLADIDKVVAIKNSTPNMNQFLASFFAVKDKIRYFGFPMNELGISMTVDHGADGTMGAGAVLGHVHPGFYNSIWHGDYKQAIKYGRQDQFLFQSWFNTDFSAKYGSPQAIVKAALNLQNLPGGYPRSPILPLTGEQELRVKETLEQVKRL